MNQRLTLLLPCLLLLAAPARADIYTYTDANGTESFSNVPDNKRYTLFMRTPAEKITAPLAGNPSLSISGNRTRFTPLVEEAASQNKLDAALLHALITTESGYNPRAVSRKGAMGLMQLMPGTASRYGVSDAFDPAQNVHAGAHYLSDLMQMFNQDLHLALAAYNAGEKSVIKYGNHIPPYRETMAYVPKVLNYYRKFNTTGH
jgi:soluble lytic murein transglycosylase-like protein